MHASVQPVKALTEMLSDFIVDIVPGRGAWTVSFGPAENTFVYKVLEFELDPTAIE